jgi:SAM-dependent methyltransferase
MATYQPQQYWERRLSSRLDITTVGYKGLGYIYNDWLYRARTRSLKRAIHQMEIECIGKSIIELGVGSGVWVPFWQQQGIAKLVGVDITLSSTLTLSKRYPQYNFVQSNLGAENPFYSDAPFDLVTAFDVLFHITDNHQFSTAIATIASLVKSKGFVLITDGFCEQSTGPRFHQHFRSQDFYLRELSKVALRPVHWEPIFFLMTGTPCSHSQHGPISPILLKHRFIDFVHRAVRKLAGRKQTEWCNHLIGGLLYSIDGLLGSATETGSTLKILVAQKD